MRRRRERSTTAGVVDQRTVAEVGAADGPSVKLDRTQQASQDVLAIRHRLTLAALPAPRRFRHVTQPLSVRNCVIAMSAAPEYGRPGDRDKWP